MDTAIAIGTLVVMAGIYFLMLASMCDEDDIAYSLRLTGYLFGAVIAVNVALALLLSLYEFTLSMWQYYGDV